METCYEVYLGKSAAGKVQLRRDGLYVRVTCRCQADPGQIFRLYAVTDRGRENLGVLVPEADGLLLDRKIPAKRLSGSLRFEISTGTGRPEGKFVPICPEEPFGYIAELKNAFLETEQGRVGIRTEKRPEAD